MEALQLEIDPLTQNETAGNLKIQRSDPEWFTYYGKLYLFYVDSYNSLEDCYDKMTHPQKRQLLKRMLENCMLRIIQVKKSLIYFSTSGKVIRSDFVNLDAVLMEEKRIMKTIDVRHPRFFRDENTRKREYRDQLVDKLLLMCNDVTQPEEEVIEDKPILDTIEKAVRYIQKMERARQGIERAYMAQWLKILDHKKQEKQKKLLEGTEIPEETERDDAILVIQKYYRGFRARSVVWDLRKEEQVFLGFQPQNVKQSQQEHLNHDKYRSHLKIEQNQHQNEFKQALKNAKEGLLANWADDMKDNMLKERREWYWNEISKAEGKMVPPKADQFYKREDVRLPLTEFEQEQMEIAEKERRAKKKDKGKKKKKKKGGEEPEEARVEQGPTEAVINIQNQIEGYTSNWDRREEDWNFHQTHDPSLLNEAVAEEAEKQVRKMVDQMIDIELVNLRVCIRAKKYKYPKDAGDKSKKRRGKKKKKKGSVPKPESDDGPIFFQFRSPKKKTKKKFPGEKSTAKMDPRDMLAELIEKEIVKKLMPCRMDDLIGDPYPLRYKQEQIQDQVADPSMFDLRQALVQFVGMPLGSTYVRDNIKKESNYYLFYGPNGSGKTHAVRALQTECNALIIDLSPSNIESKFQDKQDYLLNLCFKVAGYFQPSIIYIDEVEKIFKGKKKKKKKKPQSGPPEPNYAKLRKFLLRFGKFYSEKEPENVAIIGCTSAPWDANKKQIKSFFKRRFYFPCPNYATRLKLFKFFLSLKGVDLHPAFPLSSLAHITEGFSAGNIKHALDKVLTQQRLKMVKTLPFRMEEFIEPLSNQQSLLLVVYLKFRETHDELSGNKQRIAKLKSPESVDPKDKKGKKKKKK